MSAEPSPATAGIVVGIATWNNAATIGKVIATVEQGLRMYFPAIRCVIVHSDASSEDDTVGRALDSVSRPDALIQLQHRLYPAEKLASPYSGVPGKGSGVQQIFETARSLQARACAIIDPDLRNIEPDWVRSLILPVFDRGFDLIAPHYRRHRFEGSITNAVVYPLLRALFGRRLRHPIGGDFCFSPHLLERYLAQNVWDTEAVRFGPDIWFVSQAVCDGFRVGQAYLGPKIHDPGDPSVDLSSVLMRVLGALFLEMERNAKNWQRVRDSESVPLFGEPVPAEPEPAKVDAARMLESFEIGYRNLGEIWNSVLSPATLVELKKLSRRVNGSFRFQDEFWVRTVYDFAVAYHARTISRDHLLRAFTPLYLGWVASFVLEMQDAGAAEVEARIERLCLRYETDKPYLISRWRWPDRFNP